MHYYIDGYNLMFRLLTAEEDLPSNREEIISELNEKIQRLNLNATLVFDGHYRYGLGSRSHLNNLEIRFTDHGESADDFIVGELNTTRSPHRETVVTSDNKLAWRARQRLAKTTSVEKFIHWLNSQYKKKGLSSKKDSPTPAQAPPSHEFTVTDESFDFYLQEFEKKFKENFKNNPPLKKSPISELDRWEKLFEERLQEDEDSQ